MSKNLKTQKQTTRINQLLAERGIASRREADELIESGKVLVNGKPVALGTKVLTTDTITIVGKPKTYIYIAYNKPVGLVTVGAQKGEQAIPIEQFGSDIFPVGRLDKDSGGLIILTNDRRLTDRLLSPDSYHEKEYQAKVHQTITNSLLRGLKEGVRIGKGEHTRPAKVRKVDSHTFDIILTEGKNRQIRRMCNAFGFEVIGLTRFRIGTILLGNIPVGGNKKIQGKELESFLTQLKLI